MCHQEKYFSRISWCNILCITDSSRRKNKQNIKSKCKKMLNFQDLPDELVLKILSYVSGFNPIPTGNGLNQPIYSFHMTQADWYNLRIRKALISCGQVSKRFRNISRDGTLWPAPPICQYVCFVRNCNKEVKRIFSDNNLPIFRMFFSQRAHFKEEFSWRFGDKGLFLSRFGDFTILNFKSKSLSWNQLEISVTWLRHPFRYHFNNVYK